jgi:hypothetical protein
MLRARGVLMSGDMDREKNSKKQSSDKPRPAQPLDSEKQQVKASLNPPRKQIKKSAAVFVYQNDAQTYSLFLRSVHRVREQKI